MDGYISFNVQEVGHLCNSTEMEESAMRRGEFLLSLIIENSALVDVVKRGVMRKFGCCRYT